MNVCFFFGIIFHIHSVKLHFFFIMRQGFREIKTNLLYFDENQQISEKTILLASIKWSETFIFSRRAAFVEFIILLTSIK